MTITSIPSFGTWSAATRPPHARPSQGAICTPDVSYEIVDLLARAERCDDSATFTYGMGFCLGGMMATAACVVAGPLAAFAAATVFGVGGIVTGRFSAQEAERCRSAARALNEKTHCFRKERDLA